MAMRSIGKEKREKDEAVEWQYVCKEEKVGLFCDRLNKKVARGRCS